MSTQQNIETRVWHGKEMPVWRFATYTEMEASVDRLFPEDAFEIELYPDWDAEDPMWAVAFSDNPRTVDTAMVIIHVDESQLPRCESGDNEDAE